MDMERDKHRQTEAKTGKMAENRWTQRETDKTQRQMERQTHKKRLAQRQKDTRQGRAGQGRKADQIRIKT